MFISACDDLASKESVGGFRKLGVSMEAPHIFKILLAGCFTQFAAIAFLFQPFMLEDFFSRWSLFFVKYQAGSHEIFCIL
tara:strand:+ start:261 stop:500 length:240 start_codon:yes stop_codon:yes gene_type:complete